LINEVISIAKEASKAIMLIYKNDTFDIKIKSDNSPLTKADLISNEIIVNGLKKISNYPIITEESYIEYEKRKYWNKYWIVDPLDGTKDFVAKNGEFTINIALIHNQKPILGIIYIPVSDDVYYAKLNNGSFKNGIKIYNTSTRKELIGSDSNFHSSKETIDFFKSNSILNIKRFGSSLKFCKLAEGVIDVYPRFNGTKEWDTAAGDIIVKEAGCIILNIKTKKELIYNKENIQNNYFIAQRNNLNFL